MANTTGVDKAAAANAAQAAINGEEAAAGRSTRSHTKRNQHIEDQGTGEKRLIDALLVFLMHCRLY